MPSYNLGNPSDMRRLQKDMENAVKQQAKSAISKGGFPVECPKCGASFTAAAGKNVCPKCGSQINLNLDFKL